MLSARFKQSISFLLLAFFLTTKLAGLHVLTHDDSDQTHDCAICHVLITDNQTPVVLQDADAYGLQEFLPFNHLEDLEGPECIIQDRLPSFHLFSRPPPAI